MYTMRTEGEGVKKGQKSAYVIKVCSLKSMKEELSSKMILHSKSQPAALCSHVQVGGQWVGGGGTSEPLPKLPDSSICWLIFLALFF